MLSKLIRIQKFNDGLRLIANFSLNGNNIVALIDTGASANYFCSSLDFLDLNKKDYVNVVGFTGHNKRSYGVKPFTTDLFSLKFENFYALDLQHLEVNCVLGIRFLIDNGIVLDVPNYGYEKISSVNFNTEQ